MKNLTRAIFGMSFVAIGLVACSTASGPLGTNGQDLANASSAGVKTAKVCGTGAKIHCLSYVQKKETGEIQSFAAPSGLGATDLESAYKLDVSVDPKATVAIVDAYGYAGAESDLAAYRKQYNLPPCTIANGCLTIVNQAGKTSPLPAAPPSGDDWTVETALDLDMASAACPKCKLLLVQTNNDQDDGLFLAQKVAADLGATVISDSWGSSETTADPATDYEHFFAVGHTTGIFVAAGDSGWDNGGAGPDYPATSGYAISVGGTNLKKDTSARGWTETAWGGALSSIDGAGGSACGLTVPKPSYQGTYTNCKHKASADVAAVGDPSTGPAIYNAGAWTTVGGTSAASPFVAATYALTGHGKNSPAFSYQHTSAFFDVTSGSNGSCAGRLCNAGAGWDGPTGHGTPNGAALVTTKCTVDCTGKTCGNDGCGGVCGHCTAGDYCGAAGTCEAACTPSCTGKTCGEDGCGGSCGDCGTGQICGTSNTCVSCTPSCASGTCGEADGCGGTCGCANGGTCLEGFCLNL
jgi:hypothetical protein